MSVFFQSSPTIHDHRWGSEQRPIEKLKALRSLKEPVLSPRSSTAHAEWQNCVSFTNPCINPFVSTSVTREYHPKVLERLHLLQCIFAHLQNTLPWASWDTQYLNFCSADFRSCLVAHNRKSIKCALKTLLRRSTHAAPIRPQKNGSSHSSQQWHPHRRVYDCLSISYWPGLSKIFGEDHISYCKTVRGPNILRNVIFSGYVTFHQINTFFVNILFFHYWQNVLRPGEMASQVGFGPRAIV